ncbi:MAG: PQQ-like beta-propeller repeat protein [Verrucomicrobia bacterium]|nr:PQQ-like beta-propeller repeat protein [Verrucomicrobiota bacterium]
MISSFFSLNRSPLCRFRTALLAGLFVSTSAMAADWPQWLGPQRDGVWRETGIVEKFPESGPQVRWRTKIGGGYAGPAVANGRVFVADHVLAAGAANPKDPFSRGTIAGSERVLCLDESDGKILWKHEYDCPYDVSYPAGPRVTPVVHDGKVYTLGTMGNLFCFEAASGKIVWSRDFKKDFGTPTPLWGFAGHPLIDGQKLICLVGGSNSVAVAFDKDSGREIWRALTAKEPGYCPPTMIEAGGKRQLIIWHPESINSLDPETGKVYWSQPFAVQSALSVSTPRQVGDRLFFTSFYNGSMMLKLDADKPGASLVWRGQKNSEKDTQDLHSIMGTPFFENGYIYGSCSYGQFRCLKAETGERLWESFVPTGGKEARWANAFIVKQAGRFFIFNEKGDLIIAKLSPKGYEEISRAHLIDPTNTAAGRDVVWSHPAFANRSVYVRNDVEIVCASLAADK